METKFDIFDRLWCIQNNKPVEVVVLDILIGRAPGTRYPDAAVTIHYSYCLYERDLKYKKPTALAEVPEDKLFKTKKELLMSFLTEEELKDEN